MKKINGGLYLVVDPMPGIILTLPKIKAALDGGVDVIQLWNHWPANEPDKEFILEVCNVAATHNVPVIIHEHWQLLKDLPLDGVHFDTIPREFETFKNTIIRRVLVGITCGNDEERIRWAITHTLDYISFCSVFPSKTAITCEVVDPLLILETKRRSSIRIFAAGGINFDNISTLPISEIDGIAIVSGIMKAEDPESAARKYKQILSEIKSAQL